MITIKVTKCIILSYVCKLGICQTSTKIDFWKMLQLLYITLSSCNECKVYTLFQKQISRTFPELRLVFFPQDSKFNAFHSHNFKLNSPYSLQTFLKFRNCLSQADFQDFPGPIVYFQDSPVLENVKIKFHNFPGFPGLVKTLWIALLLDDLVQIILPLLVVHYYW